MNALVPIGIAAALGTGLYLFEKKKLPGQKPSGSGSKGYMQASFAQSAMSVRDVQHALNVLGASPSLVEDGVAGPATASAIRSFQEHAGITVDGVVGPQTVAALQHAAGSQGVVAGYFDEDEEEEEESSMVAGPWFLEDDEDDEIFEVGQTMAATAVERPMRGVNRRAASARGYNVVGQRASRGGRSAGGGRSASSYYAPQSQGIGPQQGYDEGSNNWAAPDVQCILSDPSQMSQIGIQQLWAAKAEEAFGPGTAYHYSSPLTQADLDAAQALATAELGGSSLGGVNLTAGEFDDDIQELVDYANAWESIGNAAVSGEFDDEEGETVVGQFGQDWSAPDICEAYRDPEQVAEMMAHAMPYGYALPYAAMPPQPYNRPIWGYPAGYGNMPAVEPYQGPYPYPGGYPYGPMTAPTAIAPQAPTLGGVQLNPATAVPGKGYEFQSQSGRFF